MTFHCDVCGSKFAKFTEYMEHKCSAKDKPFTGGFVPVDPVSKKKLYE